MPVAEEIVARHERTRSESPRYVCVLDLVKHRPRCPGIGPLRSGAGNTLREKAIDSLEEALSRVHDRAGFERGVLTLNECLQCYA
jgi:hypothetical protein